MRRSHPVCSRIGQFAVLCVLCILLAGCPGGGEKPGELTWRSSPVAEGKFMWVEALRRGDSTRLVTSRVRNARPVRGALGTTSVGDHYLMQAAAGEAVFNGTASWKIDENGKVDRDEFDAIPTETGVYAVYQESLESSPNLRVHWWEPGSERDNRRTWELSIPGISTIWGHDTSYAGGKFHTAIAASTGNSSASMNLYYVAWEPGEGDEIQAVPHPVQTGCHSCTVGNGPVLARADGRPAIAFHARQEEVRFALAETSSPGSVEDWEIHRIGESKALDDQASTKEIVSAGGRAIVAYFHAPATNNPQDPTELRIAVAEREVPTTESDWRSYTVDSGLELTDTGNAIGSRVTQAGERGIAISGTVVNGKPVFAYKTGAVVKLARAGKSHPVSPSSWRIRSLFRVGEAGGFPEVFLHNRTPAVGYYDAVSGELRLGIAEKRTD